MTNPKDNVNYDPRVIKRGVTAIKRLTDPKGSADVHDWWNVAEALKMAQDDCVYRAGSVGPYGKTYREYINDWLSRHKHFQDLPTSTRANLVEMQNHRLEIETWYALLPYPRRMKITSPSAILQNWKRDTNKGKDFADPASEQQQQEEHKTRTQTIALEAMRDKFDMQRKELAKLKREADKRCDVDLLHSSIEKIEEWLKMRILKEDKAKRLRDVLLELYPLEEARPAGTYTH